jgi:hypothetical protein
MKQSIYKKNLDWLKANPPLDELCVRYPTEWAVVQAELSAIVEKGVAEELKAYLERLSKLEKVATGKAQYNEASALSQFVRSRMAHESVKKLCLSTLAADTGVKSGKLRFNWLNGFIAQKLLFERDLVRKQVSMQWFRRLWPLVWQRKRLMPLVQPKGIYCFYSRELIDELVKLIQGRRCLEIGAGDGTLARFLKEQGVQLIATDSHTWDSAVKYPDWVVKLGAREALSASKPEVVICSWPPAQNDFERHVFTTPSVELYVVIGSRHQFAFGNWKDYVQQKAFDLEEDKTLGELVLPPELESAVYLFRRKARTA